MNFVEIFVLWKTRKGMFFCKALPRNIFTNCYWDLILFLHHMHLIYLNKLNKPISMLSFTNLSPIFHKCNDFAKAYYHSILKNYNHKHDEITLFHRWFGLPNSILLMYLLKYANNLKSLKSISCLLCLLYLNYVN